MYVHAITISINFAVEKMEERKVESADTPVRGSWKKLQYLTSIHMIWCIGESWGMVNSAISYRGGKSH